MNRRLRIFMIAGEASGDRLGASLMRALKEKHTDIEFSGIGGMQMAEAGLQSLFPMQDLSVMGLAEVLPRLFKIWRRLRQTVKEILCAKPDMVITIDSPDFSFRVAERIQKQAPQISRVHYVAPSVWAWRPERAVKVARLYDRLLCLLPFEPPYFEREGLKAVFVGHPIVERSGSHGDSVRFRRRHGIRDGQPIITLLPGSRAGELKRLLPSLSEAVDMILRERPDAAVALPTLPHLKTQIETFFAGRGINPIVVTGEEEKFDCFAASTVAIAASGTVSLELALTDTPHVIAYRVNSLTALLAKRLIKTPFVNLVNIVLNRPAVPELLQDNCTPETIAQETLRLLDKKDDRTLQLTAFREALIKLGLGDTETPSQKAAGVVLNMISEKI